MVARHFPGNLIPGCRLFRTEGSPSACLPGNKVCATNLQLGSGATGDTIEIEIVIYLDQAGRSQRFDCRRSRTTRGTGRAAGRSTDDSIAVQVLMEAGLERCHGRAGSRHDTANVRNVVAV